MLPSPKNRYPLKVYRTYIYQIIYDSIDSETCRRVYLQFTRYVSTMCYDSIC